MSLEDTMKELREQIAAQKEVEEQEEAPATEEAEEENAAAGEDAAPQDEEAPAEGAGEEQKAEEKKEEQKPSEEDERGYARLRREAAAAKKKAEEAEAKRLEAEAKLAERDKEQQTEESAAAPLNPLLEDMARSYQLSKAEREFNILETKFKKKRPDYEAVSAEYAMGLAQAIRIQNPRLTPVEVAEKTKETILIKAGNFLKDGFDPIEELYHEAKELGFAGKSFRKEEAKQETEAKEEPRPDMKKLAANRARSTGMGASNGRSEGQLTQAAALDIPIQEFAKLPIAEKRRLLYPNRT